VEGNHQAIDVRQAVDAVLRIVEPQLAAKRLDSSPTFPPDVRVLADPDRLRGSAHARVQRHSIHRARRPRDDRRRLPRGMPEDVVMIRVGDSGCGIPIERQQDIFEPAAPARHPAESNAGGTGPGLVNSRVWAREMGGDLRVRSDVDRGSVFTLKLPSAGGSGVR
jgi:C4-dicarboxylate-specific signal transduction histidine kinase